MSFEGSQNGGSPVLQFIKKTRLLRLWWGGVLSGRGKGEEKVPNEPTSLGGGLTLLPEHSK